MGFHQSDKTNSNLPLQHGRMYDSLYGRHSADGELSRSMELLVATLALKSFVKDQTGIAVLLQLDNQTAVAYINNIGVQCYPG